MKQESLIKHDHFFQLIIDNIPQFIFWKDINSIYLGCNMIFAQGAGLNHTDEIIGKSDYDLPWSKEDADFYRKIDKKVMDAAKAQINFEEPQTTSDGKTLWLRTSKIPLFDDDKNVIGILGTYEDITERKQLELSLLQSTNTLDQSNKALKTTNLELEQANIDLEQFAYATSHDLQEPLRMIGSFVSLLKRKEKIVLDEEGIEYYNFITEGVDRMSNLVKDTLNYSKIGTDELVLESTNLKNILTSKLRDLHHFIKESKAILHINLPTQNINCYPTLFESLFFNLIHNGIKFNKNTQPTIQIGFEEKENTWEFFVQDNGIGIKKEYQCKIFKAYKRLNTRDKFIGSGLGLSICKKIVSLHKGEIWFKSEEKNGTTFYFTIAKM